MPTINKYYIHTYLQASNKSFYEKLNSVQYNACLAFTGATSLTSKEKIY